MLSAPAPRAPFSFFSKPKIRHSAHPSVAPVVVTKRVVTVQRAVTPKKDFSSPPAPKAEGAASRPSLSATSSLKRKPADMAAQPPAKRPRTSSSSSPAPRVQRQRTDDSTASSSASSTSGSSRASTRYRTSPPPSEALYRSSRSRSVSVLRAADEPIPRDCFEDRIFSQSDADELITSEMVVRQLMEKEVYLARKSRVWTRPSRHVLNTRFASDFRNPEDPSDKSFDAHNFPIAELEYPNSGACERYASSAFP